MQINVRGVDPKLYRLARAEAVIASMTIGQWLNDAIKEKLKRSAKRR